MKKLLGLLLVISIIVCNFVPTVLAQSPDEDNIGAVVQPRFSYISSTSTTIGITNGNVTVSGAITCYPSVKNCSVVVVLQRRPVGGSTWTDVTNKTGSGTKSCEAALTRACASGYEYRAKAFYTAVHTSGDMETVTGYSKILRYTSSNP